MATSTFEKQFTVRPEKADDFVKEMTKTVTPTLQRDFHSELAHLAQKKDLRDNLLKVLAR